MRWPSSLLFLLGLASALPARAERPIVLELFTSQGCSSCPPAERLLGDLAAQPGVLTLAYHVDYWDRLGWKDPFAAPEWTARQRSYGRNLSGSRYAGQIYTPQMVVDGKVDAVGSDGPAIRQAMAKARVAALDIGATLARGPAGLRAAFPASAHAAAEVTLIVVDPPRMTRVARGENAGQSLREAHIVRRTDRLQPYQGAAFALDLPDPRTEPGQTLALLVQRADGVILGAAALAE